MAVEKDKLHQEESATHRLFKIILGWDYFRLLKDSKKQRDGDASSLGLNKVKTAYKDVDEYISTFEPLLLEEIKAQIIKNKEDEDVAEWKFRAVLECNEVDGFHFPEIVYLNNEDNDDNEKTSPNDLLLLSKEKFQENRLPSTYAFALVENRQQNKLRLRMHLAGQVTHTNIDAIVSCPRLLQMRSHITSANKAGKHIYSLKIGSLSTIIREYVALWSIGSLPFKDVILTASDKALGSKDQAWKISRSLSSYVNENLNESQQQAVQAGLSRKPFVLIQGPPGTGKTQTILGLLSAILHATPARVQSRAGLIEIKHGPELSFEHKNNHWGQASPWLSGNNPRDDIGPIDGDDGFYPTTGNDLKLELVKSNRKYRVRVLVCAPSNSALDEIVLRVQNSGVRDENARSYNPKIVRIGVKPHASIKGVSMNELENQKKKSMNTGKRSGASGSDVDNIRAAILDESVIVFSTLSFSGSSLFSKWNRGFDVVIIDEAAQAVEPATLVPLANGCKQVFMVGDPEQLPATVMSQVAKDYGYDTSLFKRLQTAGYPVTMLKVQYRMHPEIRSFPSTEFYAGSLEDAPDLKSRTTRTWHEYRCFGPFCFFDLYEGKESKSQSGSTINEVEAEFVIFLYHQLIGKYPELKSNSQLAIISPYRQQVKLLQERFKDTFGMDPDEVVDINTVDGFQGREKEVTIFSCVRASEEGKIGFLSDRRRMNVGITRARSSVLVVGSASTLKNDEHWSHLVESAEQRRTLFKISKPFTSFFSEGNMKTMYVKDAGAILETGEEDEMDNAASYYRSVDNDDQMQNDDMDFGGDGDDDMYEGGFDDE